jgi:hypothetical protein
MTRDSGGGRRRKARARERKSLRIRSRSPVVWLSALVALAFSAVVCGAQAQRPVRTAQIRRIEAKIRVDGRLDEPVWSHLEPLIDFVQTEPHEGAPASERTEAYIFYDNDKLYFGFKCHDSAPDKIVARYDAHDARTFSDSVNIFLDPFGDRRTGYFFSVNARGVQYDGLLTEASGLDGTWDGIWESATRLESWGWSAEVAIPFKSIRFRPWQAWGINLGRDIIRNNESDNWQAVTRFDQFMRPSKAGLLEGIANVEPGRNVELIPYGSGRVRRGAPSPLDNGEKGEGGADVRWGIRPNLTVNATINPDFAETEADEINITISRFELFFPEKRAFFNEGANFFSTPLGLFFTRRVGARLPNGTPQRLLFGAKLTGKVAQWSVGLVDGRTQAAHFEFTDPATGLRARQFAPAANFFVLRVQRDIWKNSSLGFLTVNRDQQPGDIGSTQRVHGVDLNIVAGPNVKWSSQAAYNQNATTGEGGVHRVGLRSDLGYNSERWEAGAAYKYLGRAFDIAAIGFEPETGRHSAAAGAVYKPFLGRHGIRQVFFELNYDTSIDTEGLLQDAGADADLRVQLRNFWNLRARYSYNRVRFFRFAPNFQRLAETRIYIEPRIRLFFSTNENRPLYLSYIFTHRKMAQFRENFYGRALQHELALTARLFGRAKVQFSGIFVREFLLDGTPFQNRRLFITRLNHQFTRKLRARILGQLSNDRHGQMFNVNSILAYDFTARSAFIVGYNYQRGAPVLPRDLGNEFFAKLSYLFHF